ncbi:MAG: hypothetical protein ACRDN8_05990, partial [Thermoleophilaceae bacterium]
LGVIGYLIGSKTVRLAGHALTIGVRPDYATLVGLADEEARLTGLRRRGLVLDSPRVLVRDARSAPADEPG